MLSPCPAIGWITCAASPTSAMRSATNARATDSPSGKARRAPTAAISPRCKPEAAFELGVEVGVGERDDALGLARLLGPHDRGAAALERQDRERSRRQEMLFGAAAVIALVRDRGDDARLAVVPAVRRNAGALANLRARTVGGDQEARCDDGAVGERHLLA